MTDCDITYTEKEISSLKYIYAKFVDLKAKYDIFNYINKSLNPTLDIHRTLRHLMCEALFRHIVLELYAYFFDFDRMRKSIAHVVKKFKKNLANAENNKNNNELKIILEEHVRFEEMLRKYRNNILAHKSSLTEMDDPKNDSEIGSDILEKLIKSADDLLRYMLKEIEPVTSFCTSLFPSDPNRVAQVFFKWLGADTTLGDRGATNNRDLQELRNYISSMQFEE